MVSEAFEILMVVCFGISWPVNAARAWKAGTARGQSLLFLLLIEIGYVCGIIAKLCSSGYKWYVLFFYVLNFCMVGVSVAVYFRNRRLDREQRKKSSN